jgi:trehalose 6-phosphate synthase
VQDVASLEVTEEMEEICRRWHLGDEFIGIGVDRLDYTKGIPHRFRALDKFLTKYPEYQGRVVLFQLGEPSRIHIKKYKELNAELDDLVEEINWKYQSANWKPIIYIREHLSPTTLLAFNRLAHFCIVSSLQDGMNLVAKEFVSSRTDEDGVLILSHFTGAARELTDALLVNPYATDDFAESIRKAIEMPKEQRKTRMRKLRQTVEESNIYRWAGSIITELANLGL